MPFLWLWDEYVAAWARTDRGIESFAVSGSRRLIEGDDGCTVATSTVTIRVCGTRVVREPAPGAVERVNRRGRPPTATARQSPGDVEIRGPGSDTWVNGRSEERRTTERTP